MSFKQPVVLLHGLWMRGFALTRLAGRLRACGYLVETFEYASLAHAPEQTHSRLRARILALSEKFQNNHLSGNAGSKKNASARVDGKQFSETIESREGLAQVALVGHSLGGLMALSLMQNDASLPVNRLVCLGSPLKGAQAARTITAWPIAKIMLGKSREVLHQGLPPWKGVAKVGVIAGRLPYGMAMWMPQMQGEHDGTVAVTETQLDGIDDHRIIAATHTGLLFSDEAATMTTHFLQFGQFE